MASTSAQAFGPLIRTSRSCGSYIESRPLPPLASISWDAMQGARNLSKKAGCSCAACRFLPFWILLVPFSALSGALGIVHSFPR